MSSTTIKEYLTHNMSSYKTTEEKIEFLGQILEDIESHIFYDEDILNFYSKFSYEIDEITEYYSITNKSSWIRSIVYQSVYYSVMHVAEEMLQDFWEGIEE